MGADLGKVFIDLPFEAQILIRKCTNRGLIVTRTGQVFEMKLGKKYTIDEDSTVFSHDLEEFEK